jgi:hypothetical protein
MEFIEISDYLQIQNKEIKSRTVQSSQNAYTRHYLVKDNNNEVAFLSLDLMYDRKILFLYELFVITSERKKGNAYKIIDSVFEFAKNESFEKVYLDPHPFDGTVTFDVLKHIYIKKGFVIQKDTSEIDRLAHISAACGQKNPLGIDSKLHKAATLAMSGSILKDPLGSSISMVKPLGAWIRIVG